MSKYQVIITLGGNGKRFADAGYELPKYLLPVSISNKNIKVIDLVTDMFDDGDTDIIYLCNKYHIEKYDLNNVLKYKTVVPVIPGNGPGDAILQAKEFIDFSKPTFVQYCDTFQPWNLTNIKRQIESSNSDAAVVVTDENCPSVYDGTLYGRVKVKDNLVEDIKEKAEPEYSNYLGCGTFYFRTGKMLLNYVEIQDKNRDRYYLNGESYINCTIKALLDNGKSVVPINVTGYLNLGVPRDYEEYMYWQKLIYQYMNYTDSNALKNSTIIVPAAGLGSRFSNTYGLPKPLISVEENENSPMYVEAIHHSFNPENVIIVTRKDLAFYKEFELNTCGRGYTLVELNSITEGQAITVKEGLKYIKKDGPVIINSCDQGILYNKERFNDLYKDADIIVCGIKNYQPALRHVNSFSWIKNNGREVTAITSKRCDDNPNESLAFVSCLLYKSKDILEKSIESLVTRGVKTNNEYYIDESINDSIALGYKVKVLEIDAYLNWGTPEELELFRWWKRFFVTTGLYDYLA